MKLKRTLHYVKNIIIPVLVYGFIVGTLTALLITVYKFCAKHIIAWSENTYSALASALYFLPLALLVLAAVAIIYSLVYKRYPLLKGGGIPTSVAVLRGLYPIAWLHNLIGTFFLSLSSFFIGVPLGNEGPSVQMGTAIGKSPILPKKASAWSRYVMTGGACAGFTVATGAPISGFIFAVEEAHRRSSPTIIMTAISAVAFSYLGSLIFSPIFGVSVSLFPAIAVKTLAVKDLWLPLIIGIALGLFAVAFLRFYSLINALINQKITLKPWLKIFIIFAITLICGVFVSGSVGTGHHLILSLLADDFPLYLIVILLLVRTFLTLSANSGGITGGIFLPILALGALCSAIIADVAVDVFSLSNEYYTVIVLLGVTGCISGMMKMPITAVLFSIEALSLHGNILPVIIVTFISYAVTEIFAVKSINDTVMEHRIHALWGDKKPQVMDGYATVLEGAFAVGKTVRDILWPSNLIVLSVRHDGQKHAEMDEQGDGSLKAGDVLHVRYSTYELNETQRELTAIVGEQQLTQTAVRKI